MLFIVLCGIEVEVEVGIEIEIEVEVEVEVEIEVEIVDSYFSSLMILSIYLDHKLSHCIQLLNVQHQFS